MRLLVVPRLPPNSSFVAIALQPGAPAAWAWVAFAGAVGVDDDAGAFDRGGDSGRRSSFSHARPLNGVHRHRSGVFGCSCRALEPHQPRALHALDGPQAARGPSTGHQRAPMRSVQRQRSSQTSLRSGGR